MEPAKSTKASDLKIDCVSMCSDAGGGERALVTHGPNIFDRR